MAISSIGSGYSMLQQSQQMAKSAAETLARNQNNDSLDTASQDLNATGQQNANNLAANNLSANNQAEPGPLSAGPDGQPSSGQDRPSQSNLDALLSLNQAQNYNAIGVKVVENSNERLGNLIDIQA